MIIRLAHFYDLFPFIILGLVLIKVMMRE